MITFDQIRNRLIEAIKQSGMSQTALAQALNVTQSTIAHYLNVVIFHALDTLANLCNLLDIDTNYILCQE